jgi:hypothetical protein
LATVLSTITIVPVLLDAVFRQVHDVGFTSHFEQHFERIAPGGFSDFIGKTVLRIRVLNVVHRTVPANPDMDVRLTVFDTDVRHVVVADVDHAQSILDAETGLLRRIPQGKDGRPGTRVLPRDDLAV